MPGSSPEHLLFNLQNAPQLRTWQGLSKGMCPSRTSTLASSFPCLPWGEHHCIYLGLLFSRSCRAVPTRWLKTGLLWAERAGLSRGSAHPCSSAPARVPGTPAPQPHQKHTDTDTSTGREESPCHRAGYLQPLEMLQTSKAFMRHHHKFVDGFSTRQRDPAACLQYPRP